MAVALGAEAEVEAPAPPSSCGCIPADRLLVYAEGPARSCVWGVREGRSSFAAYASAEDQTRCQNYANKATTCVLLLQGIDLQ